MTTVDNTVAQATTSDNPSVVSARCTLLLGFGIGLLADWLWWDYGPAPLTLLLLLLVFVGGALALSWYNHVTVLREQVLCSTLVLACAALMVWRTTPVIGALMFMCILTLLALFVVRRGGLHWRDSEPHHAITVAMTVVAAATSRSFGMLRDVSASRRGTNNGIRPIVQGVLLALPLVIVFTRLFMAADASFARWADNLQWLSPTLPQHLLFVLVFGWLASGMVSLAWQSSSFDRNRFRFSPGTTEVTIVLGALCAIFIVFAGFQLVSLFSPAAANVARSGLSIAEYARHGFFQLIGIAVLALGVLAAFAGCHRQPWYRRLGMLLLVCVATVLASAVQRMHYYLQSYGLSVDRVVASTVMLWLALCLIAFAATVLRQRPAGILALAAWLGVALCLVLALINPAALVVHTNVAQARQSQKPLDLAYLLQLEADAVPALLDEFTQLDPATQCRAAVGLIGRWWNPDGFDGNWRNWQMAQHTATRAVHTNAVMLQQAAMRSGHAYYNDVANFSRPQPDLGVNDCR